MIRDKSLLKVIAYTVKCVNIVYEKMSSDHIFVHITNLVKKTSL